MCCFSQLFITAICKNIYWNVWGLNCSQVLAIIGDIIPNERRASAMGKVMAAFSVASIVGVPFGLTLADWFNWHTPFFTLGGIGIIIIGLIYYGILLLMNI
jgi:MFS transporter, DHA1 family, inner membrane transport protein